MLKQNKISHLVFLVVCASILVIKTGWFVKMKDKPVLEILNWDMFGYYLYLPATFIYNDVGMENNEWLDALYKKYEPSSYPYQYAEGIEGRKVNIYSMGMAVVYAPGFFMAQAACKIFGYTNDGYSKPFELFAVITSFLVFVLNVYLLRKVLLHFFEDKVAAVVLLVTVAGTNFFYQSGIDSVMVHNYVSALLSAVVLLTIKWHHNYQTKTALQLAACLGLAALIRPPAVLFALVPLLWNVYDINTIKEKVALISKYKQQVILMIMVIFFIGLPQLIYFKYVSGSWLSFNRGETMDLFHAHLRQFLFSYKKGWLLYTPVMVFALIGFYFVYKKQKQLLLAALLIVVLQVWMLASWDAWWFHTSYGQRGMVDVYTLLSLPLGYLIQSVIFSSAGLIKVMGIMLFSLLVFVSLFQTWQYMFRILHWERTTQTSYWKVFLKTHKPNGVEKFYEVDRTAADDSAFIASVPTDYKLVSTKEIEFKSGDAHTTSINGETFYVFNNDLEFAPDAKFTWKELTEKDHIFFNIEAEVMQTDTLEEPTVMLAAKSESDGKFMGDKVNRIAVADTLIGKLQTVHLNYITPLLRHKTDLVTIFMWNYRHKKYLFKSLKIKAYEPVNQY